MRVAFGDITQLNVDAIVNAANESLIGGSGVAGAIHRAAGPALFDECRAIGGCNEGEAKLTKGYCLPAKFIIHTVGPVWEGGQFDEAVTLRKCYESCLGLASDRRFESIAFPCISTGAYEFPTDLACEVAVNTVSDWLSSHEFPKTATFCCFGQSDADLYRRRLANQDAAANRPTP